MWIHVGNPRWRWGKGTCSVAAYSPSSSPFAKSAWWIVVHAAAAVLESLIIHPVCHSSYQKVRGIFGHFGCNPNRMLVLMVWLWQTLSKFTTQWQPITCGLFLRGMGGEPTVTCLQTTVHLSSSGDQNEASGAKIQKVLDLYQEPSEPSRRITRRLNVLLCCSIHQNQGDFALGQ